MLLLLIPNLRVLLHKPSLGFSQALLAATSSMTSSVLALVAHGPGLFSPCTELKGGLLPVVAPKSNVRSGILLLGSISAVASAVKACFVKLRVHAAKWPRAGGTVVKRQ